MNDWFDCSMLSRICCPVCKGDFQPQKPFLLCRPCGLAYPVREGVPLLLKARARALRNAHKEEVG